MLYTSLIERHLWEKKTILTDRTGNYTYGELHNQALDILAYFYQQGVKRGDRVLIQCHNDCSTVMAVLACLAGGLIFILAPENCMDEELAYIIEDSSPSIIFSPKETEIVAREKGSTGRRSKIPVSAGAYILYTSGSSGRKKGVFACQKQIDFCCRSILARLNYQESDRVLCSIPMEFDYGLYQVFLSLWSRAHLFFAESCVIQMIPKYLYQWDITVFPTIPSVVNLLLKLRFLQKTPFPYLRCITFTGEYLSVEQIKKLRTILPQTEIIPMYGTTECKRIAIMPPQREEKTLAGSCGLPLDGVKIYLKKDDPQDAVGELIVEGPNVMEGYWNQPNGGFGVNEVTGQRTYATGDLLSIDEEGFLYFYGRRNGLIKCRGYRISEFEVENIIQQIEGILECAVISIPNDTYGEIIGVCIYIRSMEAEMQIHKVMKNQASYMNAYKIFSFFSPLPKNSNGKIDKLTLRNMIDEK